MKFVKLIKAEQETITKYVIFIKEQGHNFYLTEPGEEGIEGAILYDSIEDAEQEAGVHAQGSGETIYEIRPVTMIVGEPIKSLRDE